MESKPELTLKKLDNVNDKEDFFSQSSQEELDTLIDNLRNDIEKKKNFLNFIKNGSIKERKNKSRENNIALGVCATLLLFIFTLSTLSYVVDKQTEMGNINYQNYNNILFKHNTESEALINEYTLTNASNTFYKEDFSKILNSVNADNSDLSNLLTLKKLASAKSIETVEDYNFMKDVLGKYMQYNESIIKDNKIDRTDSDSQYLNSNYLTGRSIFISIFDKDKFLMNPGSINSKIILDSNRVVAPSLNEAIIAKEVLKIVNQDPEKFEISMKAKNIFKKFNIDDPHFSNVKMKSYLKENNFSLEEINKISSLYINRDFVSIPYNYATDHNLFRVYYEKISD